MTALRYGTITRRIGRERGDNVPVLMVHTDKGNAREIVLSKEDLMDIIVQASKQLQVEVNRP